MDVDEDEEDGDEQGHPARDDLRIYQEAETMAVVTMAMAMAIMQMRMMDLMGIFAMTFFLTAWPD